MHDCIAFDRDTGICKNTKKRVGSENNFLLDTVYTCCRSVLLPPGAANERAAVPAGAFSQLISLEGNLSGRGLIDKYRMAADAKTN